MVSVSILENSLKEKSQRDSDGDNAEKNVTEASGSGKRA